MTKIKIHIFNVKLPFYPPCEVKYRLQNGVSTSIQLLPLKPKETQAGVLVFGGESKKGVRGFGACMWSC